MANPQDVTMRQLQGYAALFSCLPSNGKAREYLSLALALDESRVLDRVGPPEDTDTDEGYWNWLESLWAADGLTKDEKRLLDWQKSSDNIAAAIDELQTVTDKLQGN